MSSSKIDFYSVALAALLIFFAAALRFAPHPANFTPILAIGLLGGAVLPRRAAFCVPLGAMLLSDVALGYGLTAMSAVIYFCFAAGVGLGWLLRENRTWKRTLAATLAGSLLFFVVTNFAVWLGPTMPAPFNYAKNFAGLMQCYAMALPFFRNSLAGDLFWTFSLFGVYDAAIFWAKRRALVPVEMRSNPWRGA